MKTYYTYAEAKIENPNFDICNYVTGGFGIPELGGGDYFKCNPADYCSTLAEFLDAGYELSDGDLIISIGGGVVKILSSSKIACRQKPLEDNKSRYILSAAALNGGSKIPEQKKSTVTDIDWSKMPEGATHYHNCGEGNSVWYRSLKYDRFDIFALGSNEWVEAVESDMLLKSKPIPTLREKYVKVDMPINDIAKAMIDGEVFYDECGDTEFRWSGVEFVECPKLSATLFTKKLRGKFYRKTLTPVDHKQEWIEAAYASMSGLDFRIYVCNEHLEAIYDAGLACKPE